MWCWEGGGDFYGLPPGAPPIPQPPGSRRAARATARPPPSLLQALPSGGGFRTRGQVPTMRMLISGERFPAPCRAMGVVTCGVRAGVLGLRLAGTQLRRETAARASPTHLKEQQHTRELPVPGRRGRLSRFRSRGIYALNIYSYASRFLKVLRKRTTVTAPESLSMVGSVQGSRPRACTWLGVG